MTSPAAFCSTTAGATRRSSTTHPLTPTRAASNPAINNNLTDFIVDSPLVPGVMTRAYVVACYPHLSPLSHPQEQHMGRLVGHHVYAAGKHLLLLLCSDGIVSYRQFGEEEGSITTGV
jgi:hypothetical protein